MKADKTHEEAKETEETNALLAELGNTLGAIPYYGLFQPGEEPIHFVGPFSTSKSFLKQLGAKQLSEAWGKSKEVLVDLKETRPPERVTQRPDTAAN